MKTFFLVVFIILLTSCTNNNKFKYVENIKERTIGSKSFYHTTEEEITAANDTIAYIVAYNKYKISKSLTEGLNTKGSAATQEIISFQLFNSEGKNITDIAFKTKEQEQRKADDHVKEIKSSYKEMP